MIHLLFFVPPVRLASGRTVLGASTDAAAPTVLGDTLSGRGPLRPARPGLLATRTVPPVYDSRAGACAALRVGQRDEPRSRRVGSRLA
jgi:hypothetical protein